MPVKSKVKILQNFVALSEYMNFKPPDAEKISERASIFNDLDIGMFFRHIEHCALSSSRIIKNGIGDDIARAKGPILTIF